MPLCRLWTHLARFRRHCHPMSHFSDGARRPRALPWAIYTGIHMIHSGGVPVSGSDSRPVSGLVVQPALHGFATPHVILVDVLHEAYSRKPTRHYRNHGCKQTANIFYQEY